MPRKQGGKRSGAKLSIADRRKRAVELRLKGWFFRDIAEELGVDIATVHRDVSAVMEECREKRIEYGNKLIEEQIQQLDMATKAVMPLLEGRARLSAVDRLVKIQERRAKLLGFDKAQKHEAKIIKAGVYLPEKEGG